MHEKGRHIRGELRARARKVNVKLLHVHVEDSFGKRE